MAVVHTVTADDGSQRGKRVGWKVLVLGDSEVGKSNIVSRYDRDDFNEEVKWTVGWDMTLSWKRTFQVDGVTVVPQIMEEAGHETFSTIVSAMYKGTKGAMIVYDVTDHMTFRNMHHWHKKLWNYGADRNMVLILVGNKTDLADDGRREVTQEEAQAYADEHGMFFMETSARNGTNVENAFNTLLTESYRKMASTQTEESQERPVIKTTKTRSKCCIV